jgi:hypothetical protein
MTFHTDHKKMGYIIAHVLLKDGSIYSVMFCIFLINYVLISTLDIIRNPDIF